MENETKPIIGTTCWTDLGTTDPEAAIKFYTEVFGYTTETMPGPNGAPYTMLKANGTAVCAVYEMPEQQRQMGLPPHWLTYFLVESVDNTTEKVSNLGGNIIVAPFDVMDVGRMAVLQDSAGAVFALWQEKQSGPMPPKGVQGTISWAETAVNDRQKSEDFYANLLDWTPNRMEGEMEYTVFNVGEQAATGLYVMPEFMKGIPPHWLIYFNVDDCDKTVEKITSLGGEIKMPPKTIEEGRFAVVSDPQGGVFGIISPQEKA